MKKPRCHVTDHAVLRYLEREWGVNVEKLRRRIGQKVDTGIEHGANAVIKDGLRYVLRDSTVVSVVPHNLPSRGKCRPRKQSK